MIITHFGDMITWVSHQNWEQQKRETMI